MGHDIVVNMENLHLKQKVQTHVFSAVTASASCGETCGRYYGWLVVFKHKRAPPLKKQAN